MKKKLFSLALCLAPFAAHAQNGESAPKRESHVAVTKVKEPEKALKFEVLIPAKPADVWQAFTTSAGLDTWLWQDCTVDLREGGGWTVHYPGGKTGGGTIVSFREDNNWYCTPWRLSAFRRSAAWVLPLSSTLPRKASARA
jgi:hypothetical protein